MTYEAQSEQVVTRLVAASLADEPTLAQAFEVLEHATAACVRATERVHSLAPPTRPIQCDQGCAWCCTMRVAVTPLEILRIADYLHAQLTEEDLAALQARFVQTLLSTHDLTWQQHVRLSLPCPLLRDNLCSVHPVRPFVCRSHNSLDVKCCEEFSRVPTEMMVPMYRPQQDITNGTARGLSAGLTAAGLDGEYRELVSALHMALGTPDAGERWLAGEPVFSTERADADNVIRVTDP